MSNVETFYGVQTDVDVTKALLWQYNDATKLRGLLDYKKLFLYDQSTMFWCWYLFEYFYIPEADEKGLAVWSIILNYGISVSQPSSDEEVWGFGDDDEQFDQAPFSAGNGTVALPIKYVRIVLHLRYFQLTTSGTVTQINAFMKYLMDTYYPDEGKTIIVIDNLDMTITYRLNFTPDIYLRFILDNLDLMPRPAAVGVDWESLIGPYWGFGDDDEQFDQAPFF